MVRGQRLDTDEQPVKEEERMYMCMCMLTDRRRSFRSSRGARWEEFDREGPPSVREVGQSQEVTV